MKLHFMNLCHLQKSKFGCMFTNNVYVIAFSNIHLSPIGSKAKFSSKEDASQIKRRITTRAAQLMIPILTLKLKKNTQGSGMTNR